MTNTPAIEVIETLTFPLMSAEIQTGNIELTVTCRIAWDMSNGMYCEPLVYNFDGTDHAVSTMRTQIGIHPFIRGIVASEYTTEHLENILRDHPAFEEARRCEFDLIDTDRAEYMEAVY